MTETKLPENTIELLKQLKSDGIPPSDYATHIDYYLSFRARAHHVPYCGTFELTPLCNLSCKMCYIHLTNDQLNGRTLLPTAWWKEMMRQAKDCGMRKARLTGGECLTYPGFDELYLYLQSMGVNIILLTNGVLLDAKRIAFLKQHPPLDIQVTLYGSSDDAYERVTGHRLFSRVWENLQMVKDAHLPLSIAITPSVFMEEDSEALLQKAQELGVKYTINTSLFPPREDTGRHDQNLEADMDIYLKLYKMDRAFRGIDVCPISPEDLPEEKRTGSPGKGIWCGAGRSGFEITWNGHLYGCTNLPMIHTDLTQTCFAEGWKQIVNGVESIVTPGECPDCVYRDYCVPCVAAHLQDGHTDHCNSYYCDRVKRLVAEGIYVLEQDNPDDRPDCL